MDEETRINLRPGLIGSGIIFLIMLILSAWGLANIPADQPVATHFGITGEPDGYSSRTAALLTMPILVLVMAGLFSLIALVEPRKRHIRMSMKAYNVIFIGVQALMLLAHAHIILYALGRRIDIGLILPIAIGLLFMLIGNYMGKVRSNYFMGVRTPWTLSSEVSWNKSNRFGGKLLILVGAISALGVVLNDLCIWTILLISELLLIAASVTVYSYMVWKSDPNKKQNGEQSAHVTAAPTAAGHSYDKLTAVSYVLVVLLAVGLFSAGRLLTPGIDVEAEAGQVVLNLMQGDYAAASSLFDGRMRQALPPDRLQATMQQTVSQFGPFQEITGTRTQRCWPYTIVYVTVQLERRKMDIRVVFSYSGKVSGLWITPAGD